MDDGIQSQTFRSRRYQPPDDDGKATTAIELPIFGGGHVQGYTPSVRSEVEPGRVEKTAAALNLIDDSEKLGYYSTG